MKVLHILRDEPDDIIERLINVMTEDETDESTVEALFKDNIDWNRLVDDIFRHDKVICWW